MKYLFYELALSDPAILRHYMEGELIDRDQIDRIVFVESRKLNPKLPDYIHKNYRDSSINRDEKSSDKSITRLLLNSFESITEEFLYFRDRKVYVKTGMLEPWQIMLTRLTPLPLISFAIYKEQYKYTNDRELESVQKIIENNLEKSSLPSVFQPFLESLIENEGLNELHIHLNGTTEIDHVWQDALRKPLEIHKNIKNTVTNEAVREQYLQIDDYINEASLYQLLKIARSIRYLLANEKIDRSKLITRKNTLDIEYINSGNFLSIGNYRPHPMHTLYPALSKKSDLVSEALFLVDSFAYMEKKHNELFAHCFYFYLLILGYFNRLLVQQTTQYGFDQFQKITLNELREFSEKSYQKRFKQLEGIYGEDLVFLEGRFSPKDTIPKNSKLLKNILGGFDKYSNKDHKKPETLRKHRGLAGESDHNHSHPEKWMSLKLIAHFIKEEDKNFCFCRHYRLRKDNARRTRALRGLLLLRKKEKFRNYVVGIDAAANELHTPPEVYAPVFRAFRRSGFTNFTYHVGEDYVHLISGIRAVYEAVIFLELNEKNRIGHGTALGIQPRLWQDRAGREIMMYKGEWLDNLIFSYMILSEDAQFTYLLNKIEDKIYSFFREIYQTPKDNSFFGKHLLILAWKLRHLDPLVALDSSIKKQDILDLKERKEFDSVDKEKKANSKAFDLFEKYHSEQVVKNYRKLTDVKTNFLPSGAISFLQRKTIELLNDKGVAIESMPTSNVRISYYDHYRDHHIFRWLNISGNSDLPKPVICLCSDDPGIFATNLRNEFSHVYQTLVEDHGVSHEKSSSIMKELNENARVYRFNR